ncbi:Kinesin-like protein KIN-7N [Diplonema papillatum]|nr:Kinesin-like protein KIN-7N [Diplonema papillatum]
MTDKIKVYVRLRPPLTEGPPDVANGYGDVLSYTEHRICPLQGKEADRGKGGYVFQRVFAPEANNEDVFQELKDVTTAGLDGVSGTILAYGQTATGKTHTMKGSETDGGISERVVTQLFDEIARRPDWKYVVEIAYFEIHNEKVYDLLAGNGKELEVRVDSVQGLQFDVARNAEDAKASLLCGEVNRKKGKTDLNEHSSRSHSVLRLQVTGCQGGKKRKAQLHLVDLAGSENAKAAGYQSESTQREGGAINKSLLALTNVIKSLADKQPHVNYRDSKLTRILTTSLGGSARTHIVCCITAAQRYFSETMSTLHFADRARVVFNAVKVNEVDGSLSVAWDTHAQIQAMYFDDLDIAEHREQQHQYSLNTEVANALRFSASQFEKEATLFAELDFIMQQKLENVNKQAQSASKDLSVRTAECAKLQAEMQQLKSKQAEEVEAFEGKMASLTDDSKGKLKEKLDEICALNERIDDADARIKEVTSERDALANESESTVSELSKAKELADEKLQAAKKQLKDVEKQVKEKDKQLKEKDKAIARLEAEVEEHAAYKAQKDDESGKLSEAEAKLRSDAEQLRKTVADQEMKVMFLESTVVPGNKRAAPEEADGPSHEKEPDAPTLVFVKRAKLLKDVTSMTQRLNDKVRELRVAKERRLKSTTFAADESNKENNPGGKQKAPTTPVRSPNPKKRAKRSSPARKSSPTSKISSVLSPAKTPTRKVQA